MAEFLCLNSQEASIVLELRGNAPPAWRHCGARVDPAYVPALDAVRGPATYSLDQDFSLSMIPPAGLGWFGPSVLDFHLADGRAGIFSATACSAAQTEGQITLIVQDSLNGLELKKTIRKLAGGAFQFKCEVRNTGSGAIVIDRLASALVPLDNDTETIISWRGRHNAELVECREPMPQHTWLREGRRGISGHGGAPGLYILAAGTTRDRGLAYALQLEWSGDSRLAVERNDEGFRTLCAEARLSPAGITLAPGATLAAAPAILAISTAGRNGAMAQQHAAVRAMIQWPDGAMKPRPVHLNSWEACYFDHDAHAITALAEQAAAIGIERFVLDDGWFRGRNDDTSSLGDWTPDIAKFPDGLGPVAAWVEQLGMEFGLWVEPEMVNPDSDLYRQHADWALETQAGNSPTARNQLVLDMRREDVQDYLFAALDRLLTDQPIRYLKWDHNRDLAPGAGPQQVFGTYRLFERLRAAHPSLEIEGCAGGGGRSDAGLAPYVHRFWTSDCIDAAARIGMQRGFLAFLPPEMMGSHIGASPAHATGRRQSMDFRAAVACMGHLGIELDPASLTEEDRAKLVHWIGFFKSWRHVLHGGAVMLGEGTDGLQWQAQGNGDEWLVFVIRSGPAQDRRPQPVKLPFAARANRWTVRLLEIAEESMTSPRTMPELFDQMRTGSAPLSGSWLAQAGLPIPPQRAESVAIFHLQAAQNQ